MNGIALIFRLHDSSLLHLPSKPSFLYFHHAASGEVLLAEVPVAFLKKEPKVEEILTPTTPSLPSSPSSAQPQAFSPDEDNLPGTASLMSRPRGRGRPRKIKPEVELHLRTAKIRRRRRSGARSAGEEGPGSPNAGTHNLTQVAFQSWLSQPQDAVTDGTCAAAADAPEGHRPEESVKEMAEKRGKWFNLIPKQPCDANSLTECPAPSSPPKLLPSVLPALAAPLLQVCQRHQNDQYIYFCFNNALLSLLCRIFTHHLSPLTPSAGPALAEPDPC